MISVLVLHDTSKYQEVKEIFMFSKSPWHPMLIYSLVFPVSSNISCLLCKTPTVHLLEFTPPQKASSITSCSKRSHIWAQTRLLRAFPFGSWKPPGKEIAQPLRAASSTVWLSPYCFFFLLTSSQNLLCYNLQSLSLTHLPYEEIFPSYQ